LRRASTCTTDHCGTALRVNNTNSAARCAVLCLRPRLETLAWIDGTSSYLRLLGEKNTTHGLRELRALKQLYLQIDRINPSVVRAVGALKALEVLSLVSEAYFHPSINFRGLHGLVALRELRLSHAAVTNDSVAELDRLLPRLYKLDLSGCPQLKAISNLAPCLSLRELNLSGSGVEDLRGLDKLVALETLTIKHPTNRIKDWSVLRHCPQLVGFTAAVSGLHYSANETQAMVDNAAHCLVRWHLEELHARKTPGASRQALCFLRCAVLQELDLCDSRVDSSSIRHLAEIPALEVLNLSDNPLDDVSALAGCRALRELCLRGTQVTDEGIVGLERIVTLEKLDLGFCHHLTNVTNFQRCTALRELVLGSRSITNAGIEGLERITTLTGLSLDRCELLTRVSMLRHSNSLRELDISSTQVTGAGIAGLEEIRTLERLTASSCKELDDVTSLKRCRALRFLDLESSSVTDASMAALACVATLEILNLSTCQQFRDVSGLSGSVSLRHLKLSHTNVDNAGIAGLESMPSLTSLNLEACEAVTNVTHLIRSTSLQGLGLSSSGVTDVGIAGIEMSPALQYVALRDCRGISDVAAVRRRAADHFVKVFSGGD
jgi:Leucine-rich repeat (LRR) protein